MRISDVLIPFLHFCLFLLANPSEAQEHTSEDSLKSLSIIEYEKLNRNNQQYEDILRYTDPILYFSLFPQFDPIKSRPLELENGEGKNGYWLEANITHRINLYTGKYYSPRVFRPLRFTLDAAFTLRATQDDSYPLLPSNNKFGLGIDYLLTPFRNFEDSKLIVWLTGQLHHYSNGQSSPFFIDNPIQRNNYRNGDFSTNYVRGFLNFAKQSANGEYIVSWNFGYQRDLDLTDPLNFSKELFYNYGVNRLLLNFQWLRTSKYRLVQRGARMTAFDRRSEWRYRADLDLILDKDLSAFPTQKKYRAGLHNYISWMPFITSDVGFVFHDYIGRDYLNIRFDDIIHTYQLGVIIKLNNMYP